MPDFLCYTESAFPLGNCYLKSFCHYFNIQSRLENVIGWIPENSEGKIYT